MTTLPEFLTDRIAEDESAARAVEPLGSYPDFGGREQPDWWVHEHGRWDAGGYPSRAFKDRTDAPPAERRKAQAVVEHFNRHDPARVLAECEAKRRIVALHRQAEIDCNETWCEEYEGSLSSLYETMQALALPYADHEQFREEWRA